MGLLDPITGTVGMVSTLVRAGMIAPMRPDKYLRIGAAMQRENMAVTSGFAAAAQRCGDRAGLVDEFHLFLTTRVVGSGIRFFPDGVALDLELLEQRRFASGLLFVRYRPR